MRKRPTIHDVALRAGVSKSLVAVVFNSDTGVSEARRAKVLQAARELGYTPNAWARTLRSTSGGFVGIIVADFHNPLFTEIADVARQTLAAQGVFSFVATASVIDGPNGKIVDPEPIHHVLDLKPTSILIVGGLPEHSAFSNLPSSMPIVVAVASATNMPSAVSVRTDDRAAMKLVVDHLRSLGHARVAYVGPEGRPVMEGRRQAFEAECTSAGIAFTTVSTGDALDERGGLDATTTALELDPRPTAIVCFNDNIAFGAQSAVSRAVAAGKPDVAVTGFDNTFIAQLDRISLTSINQNVVEVVRRACAILTNEGEFASQSGREMLVEPELVVRSSTSRVTA